jgi:hypothetical protein
MLTIYAPSDRPQSKCWEVFNGIQKTWPDTPVQIKDNDKPYYRENSDTMFWGLVNNNTNIIRDVEYFGLIIGSQTLLTLVDLITTI